MQANAIADFGRTGLALLLFSLMSLGIPLGSPAEVFAAGCPERPACHGCGCKGGPGYRGPDGRCVGFKALAKTCGTPPETRCTFENARGTGLNRDCVLGDRKARSSSL